MGIEYKLVGNSLKIYRGWCVGLRLNKELPKLKTLVAGSVVNAEWLAQFLQKVQHFQALIQRRPM